MAGRGGVPGRAHDTIRPDVAALLRVAATAHAQCGEWPWMYPHPGLGRRPLEVQAVDGWGAVVRVNLSTLLSARHMALLYDGIGGWVLTEIGKRQAAAMGRGAGQ